MKKQFIFCVADCYDKSSTPIRLDKSCKDDRREHSMALSAIEYWDQMEAECFATLETAQKRYADKGVNFDSPEVLGFLMYAPLNQILVYAVSYLKLLAYRNYLERIAKLEEKLDSANILGEGMGN